MAQLQASVEFDKAHGIFPIPPTSKSLWAHLLRSAPLTNSPPSDFALPPIIPMVKNTTSMRALLQDTQTNFEKFSVKVDKLCSVIEDSRREISMVNSVFQREHEILIGEIVDLVNRSQTQIQKSLGSPSQAQQLDQFTKHFELRLEALDRRVDAVQTFNQTHSQKLQVQIQAIQSLQDQQSSIVTSLMPLLPLVQAIPLHVESALNNVKDFVLETVMPHLVRDLRSSSLEGPCFDSSYSSKRKWRRQASTRSGNGASSEHTNKRLRTCTPLRKMNFNNIPVDPAVLSNSRNAMDSTTETEPENFAPSLVRRVVSHSDDDNIPNPDHKYSKAKVHIPSTPQPRDAGIVTELTSETDKHILSTIQHMSPRRLNSTLRKEIADFPLASSTSISPTAQLQILQRSVACSDVHSAASRRITDTSVPDGPASSDSSVTTHLTSQTKPNFSAPGVLSAEINTLSRPSVRLIMPRPFTPQPKKAKPKTERNQNPSFSTLNFKPIRSSGPSVYPRLRQRLSASIKHTPPHLQQQGTTILSRTNDIRPHLCSGMDPPLSSVVCASEHSSSLREGRRFIPLDDDSDEDQILNEVG